MTEPTQPLLTPPPQTPLLEKPKKKSHIGLVTLIGLVIFVAVAGVGIASRAENERRLKNKTDANAIPAIATLTAQTGANVEDIVLPGTLQAWHQATIYARTAGYLKSWNVDIGAHVKQGDVLAVIDAPDLDAQFRQAQADLKTAIANNELAQITAKRYLELKKTDSVSQQQVDTQVATAAADQATVESEQANLDHLQQQEDFKNIVAPFDGTITQRNTDVGALINGGSSAPTTGVSGATTTGQDLFDIADTSKLRVYVQVPENQSAAITPDLKAELHLPQYPQRTFPATLIQTASALDPTTRTLLIELEANNPDGALLAGGYTDVHLKIPASANTVMLPVNALLFRDGMHVGVVVDNHVRLKPVTIGRDYGKVAEITDGLSPGDIVVVNPPDSLEDGQEVRVIQPKDQKDAAPKDQPAVQEPKAAKNSAADQAQSNDQPAQKDIDKDMGKKDDPNSAGKTNP